MQRWAGTWCERAISSWQEAALLDYAPLMLAVVVAGWFCSRMTATS